MQITLATPLSIPLLWFVNHMNELDKIVFHSSALKKAGLFFLQNNINQSFKKFLNLLIDTPKVSGYYLLF
jgi:hypothetical protein